MWSLISINCVRCIKSMCNVTSTHCCACIIVVHVCMEFNEEQSCILWYYNNLRLSLNWYISVTPFSWCRWPRCNCKTQSGNFSIKINKIKEDITDVSRYCQSRCAYRLEWLTDMCKEFKVKLYEKKISGPGIGGVAGVIKLNTQQTLYFFGLYDK